MCDPDCEYEPGHLDKHPCGRHVELPGSPCRFCEKAVPLDGSACPDCWIPVPDNLADAKALFARIGLDLQ